MLFTLWWNWLVTHVSCILILVTKQCMTAKLAKNSPQASPWDLHATSHLIPTTIEWALCSDYPYSEEQVRAQWHEGASPWSCRQSDGVGWLQRQTAEPLCYTASLIQPEDLWVRNTSILATPVRLTHTLTRQESVNSNNHFWFPHIHSHATLVLERHSCCILWSTWHECWNPNVRTKIQLHLYELSNLGQVHLLESLFPDLSKQKIRLPLIVPVISIWIHGI